MHRLFCYSTGSKGHQLKGVVGDSADEVELHVHADAGFAGETRDSKSTSGMFCALVGPKTFVPLSWFCKKQTATSTSSSEAEVIALDAGLRLEGLPLLTLWETVLSVFAEGKPSKTTKSPKYQSATDIASMIDYVPPNVKDPTGKAKLLILEDNDPVIKMCVKGRSMNMRHVSRTHRVNLDWLFERIRTDPGISLTHVPTTDQIADILTKSNFVSSQWQHLLNLTQIGPRVTPSSNVAHSALLKSFSGFVGEVGSLRHL